MCKNFRKFLITRVAHIHRDIKPGNIILKNNAWEDPVLVDFGMSHHEDDEKKEISLDQEIDNRFLRLPEFSTGSTLKRDPRSDITHCAGVFFYMLTNIWPSVLIDENECMPHQRTLGRKKLLENSDGLDIQNSSFV